MRNPPLYRSVYASRRGAYVVTYAGRKDICCPCGWTGVARFRAQQPGVASGRNADYQPAVPGPPLNGPSMSDVIQPP